MTPVLGQRVEFGQYLRRRSEPHPTHWTMGKAWRPAPAAELVSGAESLSGIVVGARTLANGTVAYGGDDGSAFRAADGGYFPAYLVAFDLRRKPVHVLPEHLSPALAAAEPPTQDEEEQYTANGEDPR